MSDNYPSHYESRKVFRNKYIAFIMESKTVYAFLCRADFFFVPEVLLTQILPEML